MRPTLTTLSAVLLAASFSFADEGPDPIPVKQWLATTERTLADAARATQFSKTEKMWDALDKCVPDRLVELRAKVKTVRWQDGVAKISIERPLGWSKSSLGYPPVAFYESTFYVTASEQEAIRLSGAWLICISRWTLTKNFADYYKKRDTQMLLARISVGNGKYGYFVSDKISLRIKEKEYPVNYAATF